MAQTVAETGSSGRETRLAASECTRTLAGWSQRKIDWREYTVKGGRRVLKPCPPTTTLDSSWQHELWASAFAATTITRTVSISALWGTPAVSTPILSAPGLNWYPPLGRCRGHPLQDLHSLPISYCTARFVSRGRLEVPPYLTSGARGRILKKYLDSRGPRVTRDTNRAGLCAARPFCAISLHLRFIVGTVFPFPGTKIE